MVNSTVGMVNVSVDSGLVMGMMIVGIILMRIATTAVSIKIFLIAGGIFTVWLWY